jgi:hypothetical protein
MYHLSEPRVWEGKCSSREVKRERVSSLVGLVRDMVVVIVFEMRLENKRWEVCVVGDVGNSVLTCCWIYTDAHKWRGLPS